MQLIVGIAAFLSSLVAADRLFHVYAFVYYRYIRRFKPEHRYTLGSLPESENESEWPHVAMQVWKSIAYCFMIHIFQPRTAAECDGRFIWCCWSRFRCSTSRRT